MQFQKWYANLPLVKAGLNSPNPDDPEHFYDYRAAYINGAVPSLSGHLPSQFKTIGNARGLLGGVDTMNNYSEGQGLADMLDPQNIARGTRGR